MPVCPENKLDNSVVSPDSRQFSFLESPVSYSSIAAVSRATGIGVETLRAWERRYGKPKPRRLPSGHRRYTDRQVEWLRKVAEAIAAGHAPSEVVPKSPRELERLLATAEVEPNLDEPVEKLLNATLEFDREAIERLLRGYARRFGNERLVDSRIAPLLTAVGNAWESGVIDICHEHFLSEILERLLAQLLSGVKARENAPIVLMTTLPGESHRLGLHSTAVVLCEHGLRVESLGADTPVDSIIRAAEKMRVRAVGISVSLANASVETERSIRELRERIGSRVAILAGGQGARRLRKGVKGVDYFSTLDSLREYLDTEPFEVEA